MLSLFMCNGFSKTHTVNQFLQYVLPDVLLSGQRPLINLCPIEAM